MYIKTEQLLYEVNQIVWKKNEGMYVDLIKSREENFYRQHVHVGLPMMSSNQYATVRNRYAAVHVYSIYIIYKYMISLKIVYWRTNSINLI